MHGGDYPGPSNRSTPTHFGSARYVYVFPVSDWNTAEATTIVKHSIVKISSSTVLIHLLAAFTTISGTLLP